jgi:hypothetical protein
MPRNPEKGGCALIFAKYGFLTIYYDFLLFFMLFLEDLEPDLRPDLGRKLGGEPKIHIYKNHRFFDNKQVKNKRNVEDFESQSHFYVEKPSRRETLHANFGSYAQPFSMPTIVLDS